MGAGQSVHQIEQLKAYADVQNLLDSEVDELYNHLLCEYNLKLREIRVKRMEDVLTRRLTVIEKGEPEKHEVTIAETKNESSTPNVPQRLLKKLFAQEQMKKTVPGQESSAPQTQVHEKALQILGDAELNTISREILPQNAKVTVKALKRLGEEKILPERLQKRLGAPMTTEQLKAQKKVELKEEETAQIKRDMQKLLVEQANEDVLGKA